MEQKSFTMMLTGARRVFVHNNSCYFQIYREFDVVTGQIGQIVRYFQLNGRGGGRSSRVIEAECRLLANAAGLRRRFSRPGTL